MTSQTPDDPHTGLERPIQQVEHQIQTTEAQLKSQLAQLGLPTQGSLLNVQINPEKYLRPGKGRPTPRSDS